MGILDNYEIATELRNLLRRADTFGYDLQTLKEEILHIAETKESDAEKLEMQMIIEAQRDLVEAS